MDDDTVQKVNDIFTDEALKANDGKVVPLRLGPGGPIIGEATMHYVPGVGLNAEFQVDDPKVAEFLNGPMPNMFE